MHFRSPWTLPASFIALGLILVVVGAVTSDHSLSGETGPEALQPARLDAMLPPPRSDIDAHATADDSPPQLPSRIVEPSAPQRALQLASADHAAPPGPAARTESTARTDSTARIASTARTHLKYEGRSFDEWHASFQNELKAETRRACLPALVSFGRHGYGPEAAAALLQALEAFPPQLVVGDDAEDEWDGGLLPFEDELLQSLIHGVLTLRHFGEPALIDAAREGRRGGRSLAWYGLARNDSPDARAEIRRLLRKGSPSDRRLILACLADCRPETVQAYQADILQTLAAEPLRNTAWQLLTAKTDTGELLRTTILSDRLSLNQKRELLQALTQVELDSGTLTAVQKLSNLEGLAELQPEIEKLTARTGGGSAAP